MIAVDEHHDNRWHIDRRVSYGHLLTTLTILISVFLWMLRMETRVVLSEQMVFNTEKRMAFMETAIEKHQAELLRKIEKLDDRVESHVEKQLEQSKR